MSAFSIPIRIYYEDTDAGGVVYYANYLRFMERARTEWLRAMGFEQDELSRGEGVVFAVRSANLEFIKPARFNDQLETTVDVASHGKASLVVQQKVTRDHETLCSGEIRLACVDVRSFVPRPLPKAIAEKIHITENT